MLSNKSIYTRAHARTHMTITRYTLKQNTCRRTHIKLCKPNLTQRNTNCGLAFELQPWVMQVRELLFFNSHSTLVSLRFEKSTLLLTAPCFCCSRLRDAIYERPLRELFVSVVSHVPCVRFVPRWKQPFCAKREHIFSSARKGKCSSSAALASHSQSQSPVARAHAPLLMKKSRAKSMFESLSFCRMWFVPELLKLRIRMQA